MATHGKKAVVGWNGQDISNLGNMVSATLQKDLAPCECFGEDEHSYEAGQRGQVFPFEGRYKGSQANCQAMLGQVASDATGLFFYAPEGADAGKSVLTANCYQTTLNINSDDKAVVGLSTSFTSEGGCSVGVSLGNPFA